MSKKTENSFSSVISVNPHKGTYLSGISSFLSNVEKPQFDKEQYAISYLNTNGFINSQISITKNIPDEDLHDAISSKIYDELALDQAIAYQVQYIETFNTSDADNRTFQVFIVDPLVLEETFVEPIKNIKYIDTVVPSPLLIKSLYTKEIIEDSGVHCFIYFQENDAFVTVYHEEEFLYTKSIHYSFIQMHERFCELYGERITYDDFLEFFSKENLRDTNSQYKEHLLKLFKELFANLNDILTYIKRAYELEKIDQIYIGTQIQTVTMLDEMSEAELGIKSSDFNFDYGYESDGVYIDQLHALMHIFTTVPEEDKYDCNFTDYPRPPKFAQRQSGKLIMAVAGAITMAFMYPVTYWVLTYAQELQYALLESDYNELHVERTTREATIKNREAEKAKALTLLNIEKEAYKKKKNTLIKIHDVKVNYPMKAKLLAQMTKDLNRYGVKVESVSYTENNETGKTFTLDLVSKKEKKITQMLEYMTKTHEGRYDFTLEHIDLESTTHDEKSRNKQYFSKLEVKIL